MAVKKPRKVLGIIGGTGLIGKGLEETGQDDYDIISVHKRDYHLPRTRAHHVVLDVLDKGQLIRLFQHYRFDAVVHAAGIANVDYVEANYAESLVSNILGTLHVAQVCRLAGCHMVYVSTNAVFNGSSAPYGELDPVDPINKYGKIKVQCEALVGRMLEPFTIVRPILMYGWNHPMGRQNPATWVINKLLRGETMQLVNDVYENPLYNRHCGEVLWDVVRRKLPGIIHIAGAETVNRYEFALKVARTFGLDASLIQPVGSSFFTSLAPRPRNTSFSTKRMETDLGLKPWDLDRGLHDMKARMDNQRFTPGRPAR